MVQPWGTVTIDGRQVMEDTDVVEVRATAGTYSIRVFSQGKEKRAKAKVTAGKRSQITVNLNK